MIQGLRKKFVSINMLLVCIVLAVVFTALCVTNCRSIVDGNKMALSMALSRRESQGPPKLKLGQRPPEEYYLSPIFILYLNRDGSIVLFKAESISLSDEDIVSIAQAALATGETEGRLADYSLRFALREETNGTKMAFLSTYEERASIRSTILTAALAMLGAIAAFFVVSMYLSRWALKPVEQAWEQQRRFVADASHELKTPLTVILANTTILKANQEDRIADQMQWVDNTEKEADRMKQLVDNLLFLAKTDDAKTPPLRLPVNLSDLVYRASLTFESLAFEREISIDTEAVAPDLSVPGDEGQLTQLLTILLDNATKYGQPGSAVTLRLCARQQRAELSVHNSGTPLSPEEQAHLFERFYRADQSRSKGGYGLGLSIAQSIVESHRGRISVVSGAGQGTTFTVSLPLEG